MKDLYNKLKEAKESKISSAIDNVCREIDLMEQFFDLAESLGLVKDGYYISGIPKGTEQDINKFYLLEDRLDYPEPQKIN